MRGAAPRRMLGPCPERRGADGGVAAAGRGRGERHTISPNLTVGYPAEQTGRGRLDGLAARSARLLVGLSAALVRLAERPTGAAQPVDTTAAPAALSGP